MTLYRQIVIVRHGRVPEAVGLAESLADHYGDGRSWRVATQDTLPDQQEDLDEADLIVTIGGDGTILRGVHEAARRAIPVLGVNMGRVGFMSEIDAEDAVEGLGWYLDGNARMEERYMLQGEVLGEGTPPFYALNDITVARGAVLRVIEVSTLVDGVHLATYRGDGVVVSTATGSTSYTLQLGGPVMDPSSQDYLIKPIATHMSQFGGVILQSTSTLELAVSCENTATLNADGFIDRSIEDGQSVRITHSPHRALFLRRNLPSAFWANLSEKLGMRKGALPRRARTDEDSATI